MVRLPMHFSRRLTLLLTLVVVALSVGFAFLTWRALDDTTLRIKRNLHGELLGQTEILLDRLVKSRAALLDSQLEAVAALAGDGATALSRHVSRGGDLQEALPGLLGSLSSRDTMGLTVFFYDAKSGHVTLMPYGGVPLERGIEQFSTSLVGMAQGGLKSGDIRTGDPHADTIGSSRRAVVELVSPVIVKDEVVGLFGAVLPLSNVEREFERQGAIPGSYTFLTDARRHLIAATIEAEADLGIVSTELTPVIPRQGNDTEQVLKSMALGDAGVLKVSLHGVDKFLAFHSLRVTPWRLGVVLPASVTASTSDRLTPIVSEGQQRAMQAIAVGSGVVLLLALLMGSWLAGHMSRPLVMLSEAARRITAGDYAQRVYLRRDDEFGPLIGAFNTMATKIERTISDLGRTGAEQAESNRRLQDSVLALESLNAALQAESAQRQQAERALRESERRLRDVIDHSQSLIFLKDLQGRYLLANQSMYDLLGLDEKAVLGQTDAELFPPWVAMQLQQHDQTIFATRAPADFEEQLSLGGPTKVFLASKFLLSDANGRAYALGGVATEITARKQAEVDLAQEKEELDQLVEARTEALKSLNRQLALEIDERNQALEALRESELRYSMLVQNAWDGVVVVHDGMVEFVNDALIKMMEATDAGALLGKPFASFLPEGQRDVVVERYQRRMAGQPVESVYETELITTTGRKIEIEISVGTTMYRGGIGTVGILRSITERKVAERELQRANEELLRLSVMDGLTQLYNRRYLVSAMTSEFARARRHESSLAILMLDLDHFKTINDRYGHQAGDAVIAHVAQLLLSRTRQSDVAARYGGEELTLLLPQTDMAQAAVLAESLRELIERSPCTLADETSVTVTVSIGVAGYPECEAKTIEQLLGIADLALYQAKHLGRNRVEAAKHSGSGLEAG